MLARYMLRNKKHKNIFKKNPKNKNSTIYVNNMVRSESVDYFSFFKHLKEPVIIALLATTAPPPFLMKTM